MLWSYLDSHGRPVAYYTDKASLFHTTPNLRRNDKDRLVQGLRVAGACMIEDANRHLHEGVSICQRKRGTSSDWSRAQVGHRTQHRRHKTSGQRLDASLGIENVLDL